MFSNDIFYLIYASIWCKTRFDAHVRSIMLWCTKSSVNIVLFFTNAAIKACDLDKFLKSIGRNPSYVDLEVSQFEAHHLKEKSLIVSLSIIIYLPYSSPGQSSSGERSTPWSSCSSSIRFSSFTRSTTKAVFTDS